MEEVNRPPPSPETAEEELQKKASELAASDRLKKDFLAVLAHELRNPLAPILHAVELMRICGMNDSDLPWMMDVVERQVKHLARLIDDLLDVSRITSGKIKLRRKALDLATVINHSVEN